MTSAERLCLVSARSEGLLADFVVLFVIRWGLERLGLDYVRFQPVFADVKPPLAFVDFLHPVSAFFNGSMFFVSGLPELVFAGMWFLYAVIGLSLFGKTLGMRQAGLVLVDQQGRKAGFFRVLIRQLVAPVSSICWIGFWPIAFTRDASALHEIASGTRLVYAKKREG